MARRVEGKKQPAVFSQKPIQKAREERRIKNGIQYFCKSLFINDARGEEGEFVLEWREGQRSNRKLEHRPKERARARRTSEKEGGKTGAKKARRLARWKHPGHSED
ncbi:hypothetical protein KM043_001676 [Ampulex compressa]|nr:hypothetical protein KM043_001676 [Ampulex compressa]